MIETIKRKYCLNSTRKASCRLSVSFLTLYRSMFTDVPYTLFFLIPCEHNRILSSNKNDLKCPTLLHAFISAFLQNPHNVDTFQLEQMENILTRTQSTSWELVVFTWQVFEKKRPLKCPYHRYEVLHHEVFIHSHFFFKNHLSL